MKKTFTADKIKLAGSLAWPLLFIIIIAWAILQGSSRSKLPVQLQLVLIVFIALAFTIPQFILALQYWKRAKSVTFLADGEKFIYTDKEQSIAFNRTDIIHVKKIRSYSKIYGNFSCHIVTIKNHTLLFNSVLISDTAFKKNFGEASETKLVGWPSV